MPQRELRCVAHVKNLSLTTHSTLSVRRKRQCRQQITTGSATLVTWLRVLVNANTLTSCSQVIKPQLVPSPDPTPKSRRNQRRVNVTSV